MDVNYADPSQTHVGFAGPIPEGSYRLPLTEGMTFDKTGAADGAGWGEGGWRLEKTVWGKLTQERSGFYLHEDGGNPGTAGCVGLDQEGLLAIRGILTQAQQHGAQQVSLQVDYSDWNAR